MSVLFIIFMYLVWGYCCSLLAEKKGYSKSWAWFWGVIGGLFAVIVYLCLGKTQAKKQEEIKKIMDEIHKDEKID